MTSKEGGEDKSEEGEGGRSRAIVRRWGFGGWTLASSAARISCGFISHFWVFGSGSGSGNGGGGSSGGSGSGSGSGTGSGSGGARLDKGGAGDNFKPEFRGGMGGIGRGRGGPPDGGGFGAPPPSTTE